MLESERHMKAVTGTWLLSGDSSMASAGSWVAVAGN